MFRYVAPPVPSLKISVESSRTLVDLFGATLGTPSLLTVATKHCWLPIMSFISCVNSGIRSSPLALGLLRWTAILAVHSELSISWPYCIVTVSARSALRSRRSPRCVWQDWAIDDALNILRCLLYTSDAADDLTRV